MDKDKLTLPRCKLQPRKCLWHCAQIKMNERNHSRNQTNTIIPWNFVHTAAKNNGWKSVYGRLHWDEFFKTTITNPEPTSKLGTVIHPSQVSFTN
jgi:hypothetical protein